MRHSTCARRTPAVTILAIALLATGCGGDDGTGASSYQAQEKARANAEERLKSLGAKLERKQYPPGEAWAVDLSGKEITDEIWTALQGLDHIAEMNFSGTKFTDEHIRNLNPLSGLLINLNLSSTEVGDAGLEQLEAMRLMQLDVSKTKATPQGVAQVLKKRSENPQIMIKQLKVKQ